MDFETMEKLPRLELGEADSNIGAKIALFENNTAYVGRLKMIGARTRGNKTLGMHKVRVVKRSGEKRNMGSLALWLYRAPYGKSRGFAVLEVAAIPTESEGTDD